MRTGLLLAMRSSALVVAAGLVLAACSGSDEGDAPVVSTTTTTVAATTTTTAAPPSTTATTDATQPSTTVPRSVPATFEAGIMPIVTRTCAQCHTGEGPGTQHVRFDTAADLVANSGDIALQAGAGLMPPWPAADVGLRYHDDWSLTPEEITAIVDWHGAGAALDVPAEKAIIPTVEEISLAEVDLAIVPDVGFDGDRSTGDEYRCLIYDPELTEPTWLAGFEFVPDQTEVVHHAIGYRLSEEFRVRAAAKDAAQTDGGGWTCFGGSGLGVDEIFLGWAPGQRATIFPEGTGLLLDPGEFLVVQIHYHFDIDAPEDRSSLHLDLADDAAGLEEVVLETLFAPAEIPCSVDEVGPLCDRSTVLEAKIGEYGPRGAPADFILGFCGHSVADFADMTDGIAGSSCDTPVRYTGQIISVLGHMHELGKSFRMILNPDTPREKVLLDIPTWDFDWQFNYNLAEEVWFQPGDQIRIECTWDRSLRDPDLEPAYVLWADGTDDEMCFATVAVR